MLYFLNNFFYFYDEIADDNNCNSRFVNINGNCYINKCYFTISTVNDHGGAIKILSSINKLLIQECTFYECTITGGNYYGGAICYIVTISGNCILDKVCANSCYYSNGGGYSGQFSYIKTSLDNRNEFYYGTISKCAPNLNFQRVCSFYLCDGKQICKNLNVSNNFGNNYPSGFGENPFFLEFTYTNLINNYVKVHTNLEFHSRYNSRKIKFCNLINNNSPGGGIISIYGTLPNYTIENCYFNLNENYLFYRDSGDLYIFNCDINHFLNSLTYGSNIYLSSEKKISIIDIFHFNTKMCIIENKINNDLISSLKINIFNTCIQNDIKISKLILFISFLKFFFLV